MNRPLLATLTVGLSLSIVQALRNLIATSPTDSSSSPSDLLVQFPSSDRVADAETYLTEAGFTTRRLRPDTLLVRAKFSTLLRQAEHSGLRRQTQSGTWMSYSHAGRSEFVHSDDEALFFSSAERLFLISDLLTHPSLACATALTPAIDRALQHALLSSWVLSLGPQPYAAIRDYLGEEIAFYFAFLGSYTTWLSLPAAFGVAAYIVATPTATIVYSLFLILWVSAFLEGWKRKMHRLAFGWGTEALADDEPERPEYTRACVSVFDERARTHQRYVPFARQLLGSSVSALACLALMAASAVTMLGCLALQDHARESWRHWPGWWAYTVYLPTVGYSLLVHCFAGLNKALATRTTEFELHRTESAQRDALAVKLVALNFFNQFASLFFLAFVKQDLDKLTRTLGTLLIVQQVVGQVLEVGLPVAKAVARSLRAAPAANKAAAAATAATTTTTTEDAALEQLNLETYAGVFGDYLEMWVQLANVVLFAPAFPLAALIALLNNVVEIRTDAFKIVHASRRPFPRRAKGMGSWLGLFEALGYLCVLTNLGLVAVVASQTDRVRQLVQVEGWREWQLLLGLVLGEHAVLALKVFIAGLINDVPEDVEAQMRAAKQADLDAKRVAFEHQVKLRALWGGSQDAGALLLNNGPESKQALLEWVGQLAVRNDLLEKEKAAVMRELTHVKTAPDKHLARLGTWALLGNIAIALGSFLLMVAKAAQMAVQQRPSECYDAGGYVPG